MSTDRTAVERDDDRCLPALQAAVGPRELEAR